MKSKRIGTFFPRIKNTIKRLFCSKRQRKEPEIFPLEMAEDEVNENFVEAMDALLDDVYVFIKDVPINERRNLLKMLSDEDTDEELIDFILDAVSEMERKRLKEYIPSKKEQRRLKKEEQKEFAKDNFYPSFE